MKALLKKWMLKYLPGKLKIVILRRSGSIGKGVKIASGAWIYSSDFVIGDNVSIGENSKLISSKIRIGKNVFIAENVTVQAAKSLEIQDDSLINKNTTCGGGQTHESTLFIGKKVHIYQDCYLNTTLPLTIEDGVGIGGATFIFTHGSWQNSYEGFPFSFGAVTIKKNAWLPWRVFVMPGVTIGENATIGSCALVGKNIPDSSFAVGVPAKVIKQGAEYIKVMSIADKLTLFKEIFERFSGHLLFFRQIKANVTMTENSVELTAENGFRYVFSIDAVISNDSTIRIAEKFPENFQGEFFNLKTKLCKYKPSVCTDDLRNIMTNFGIRFDQ